MLPKVAQIHQQRHRKPAPCGIAGKEDRPVDLRAQRTPDFGDIVNRGGEFMFGRQAKIGGKHAHPALSETAGNGAMRPRRHGGITSAVQIEQGAESGGGFLRLRPFT